MNGFRSYHPAVNFIYFACIIGFSMFLMSPVCLAASFFASFAYSIMLKGTKALGGELTFVALTLVATTAINPIFNHEGVTILSYLPSGNPLTLESILYGPAAATLLLSVVLWCSCMSEIITGDKLICLFGRAFPTLSLLFSITLRFVPRVIEYTKAIGAASKTMSSMNGKSGIFARAKRALAVLSAVITRSLESAIMTSDSMRARGWGLPSRSAYTIYRFDRRDALALTCIIALGIYVLAGATSRAIEVHFFPSFGFSRLDAYSISVYTAHIALCILPIAIELREEQRWRSLSSKN